MKVETFHQKLNEPRVVFAIQEAERKTSGEIRVLISKRKIEDPVSEAQKVFLRERMDQTAERNGVLILISPRSQKYAVIGDQGITERVGNRFWEEIVSSIGIYFKNEDFTTGVVEAIEKIGESLAIHFPRKNNDQNELNNEVIRD